jgi:hypothetical protein
MEKLYWTQPQQTPSHIIDLNQNIASLTLFAQERNFVINHKIKNCNKNSYVSDPRENINKSHKVQCLKASIAHNDRMIPAQMLYKIRTATNSCDTIT